MNRKIKFSILLILCVALTGGMLLFGMNTLKAEATEREITASGTSGEVNWTLYDDGELYIDGEGTIGVFSTALYSVSWNKYIDEITSITIGEKVKMYTGYRSNSSSAYAYTSLEKITVEEGNESFYADENGVLYSKDKTILYLYPAGNGVSEYTVPEGVTEIFYAAFKKATLSKITLPDTVIDINPYAFNGCSSLSEIKLSKNLKYISGHAFSSCSKIESISFPDSVTSIGISAFAACSSLKEFVFPPQVTYVSQSVVANCANLSSVTLPEKAISISSQAFLGCKNLKTIDIPATVTEIEAKAFGRCTGLESITIPPLVKEIPNNAFEYCTNLKNIYYTGSVTTIKKEAFLNCTALETVTIPASVTSVDYSAFDLCSGLKRINADADNTEYSNDENGILFNKNQTLLIRCPEGTQLTTYRIPETVTNLHAFSFKNVASITTVSIPDSVFHIGTDAFVNSGVYNDYANWDNGFLYSGDCLLAAKTDKLDKNCKIYSKTRLIAANTFQDADIESIVLPENLKYLGGYAFAFCSSLKEINLPDGVELIAEGAFYGCSALTEIEIPSLLTKIPDKAFFNCKNLSEIVLPDGLKTIGKQAFERTPALTEIHIPQTVTSLASDAFKSSGITDIHYGDSKAEWKRLANGATFNDATVHYTLRSDDESVIIHHTDNNFDWEAGNVHLVVEDLGNASSSYEQNGFYNRLMVDPIQVLDIKLVDGDGNDIQPLSDETITVKIKASEEFKALMKNGVTAVSNYDVDAENINFINDCFVFAVNGETVSVPADESFLKKFKIIHWYSDAVEPTDHESFTHDEISVENGYIALETNHFSEYAVCTELVEFELGEIELANGKSASVSVTVSDGTEVVYASSDERVVTVDENGVITAVGPGNATITVTISGTNISDTCEVTVPARDYTIKWIVDGIETAQTVTEQTVIAQPENPEKEGYTFIGWTPEVPDTMPAKNLEFTAVWQVNKYTVTFDTAGGTAIAPITLEYGASITPPAPPSLDGYVFKNWSPSIPDTMPASDITVTAVYEKLFVSEINIISLPNKTRYIYRIDTLDLSGIAVQVVYSDGSKEVITDTDAITAYGFSADSTGTKTVTVEYGGCTATYDIIVSYVWWQWIIRILLLGFIWY